MKGIVAVLRRWKYALMIRRSGLFDVEFYRSQCPDEPAAQRNPIRHYIVRGAAAGLDPNPFFDTSYYLEQYPDVAVSGKNPLVHFLRHGRRERRVPSARLEVADYLALQDDGTGATPDPVARHLTRGAPNRRHPLAGVRVPRSIRADLPHRSLDFSQLGGARRVLVVDHRVPTPDRDSASVRMFAILKLLRQLGHEVTFVSDAPAPGWRYDRALRRLGIEVLHGFSSAVKHLAAAGPEYRVALLSSPEAAERYVMPVRAYALGATVIYDTVDLHWLRLARAADVTGDPVARAQSARFRTVERLLATCADVTLTVTPEDREALLRDVPGARVEVLPNIHACEKVAPAWGGRRDLMFVGSFAHAPNADAVEWFVGQVLPLVQRELPGVVLHVAGGRLPRHMKRLHSATVRMLGHVPSLRPLFDASRVFVAPLRFGAGMKGKVGQSMGHGLPVVTTSVGAEGMMLAPGENALVADGAEAFAEAVIRLYTSEALWTRLSRAGLRHVEEHFSEERARTRLASLVSVVAQEQGSASEGMGRVARSQP